MPRRPQAGGSFLPGEDYDITGDWVFSRPPSWPGFINVAQLGAVGDGSNNDTSLIQAAITSAPSGSVVLFPRPSVRYRITDALVVSKALTLEGLGWHPEIHQETASKNAFTVTASNVTIRNLTISGTQFSAQAGNLESGINATGASAASPLTGIAIEDCTIRTFGDYGVSLKWVTDFSVTNNQIYDIFYAGVMGLSVQRGTVNGNRIRNIIGTIGTNAYGISATRAQGTSLVTNPRSTDIAIIGNVIQDIVGWEAIDTHGGQRISIIGNVISNTNLGIVATTSSNDGGVPTYAPLDVSIVGNTMNSTVSDGSRREGIQFYGAGSVPGSPVEKANGTIVGNTIRGYGGFDINPGSGGILVANTQGLSINGNVLIEPAPFGIHLLYNNYDAAVTGNTVIDVFSDTVVNNNAVGIYLSGGANRVVIDGNILARGDKVIAGGEKAFQYGIRVLAAAPVLQWALGTNRSIGQSANYVFQDGVAALDGLTRLETEDQAYWETGTLSELLTLSTSTTFTDTVANILPANAFIEAVVARVETTIATATDWKLGDSVTVGRFSVANATLVVGTKQIGTVQVDLTGAAGPRQTSAAKVRVTTTGTPSAGAIRITVFYRKFVAPAS